MELFELELLELFELLLELFELVLLELFELVLLELFELLFELELLLEALEMPVCGRGGGRFAVVCATVVGAAVVGAAVVVGASVVDDVVVVDDEVVVTRIFGAFGVSRRIAGGSPGDSSSAIVVPMAAALTRPTAPSVATLSRQ